ncbi:MAG: MMPL family transporter [Candidatus Sabulitectum sp.]|nr:MMPL family transporter [Candidatus Sabulitectum sp.]
MSKPHRSPVDLLFSTLRPLVVFTVKKPVLIITIGILLGVLGFFSSIKLSIDTDISNLLPEQNPTVQTMEKLRTTVGGETSAAVAITSLSFQSNRRFAEDLIPMVLDQRQPDGEPYFTRVDYRRDISFLKSNALYFATDSELESLIEFLAEMTSLEHLMQSEENESTLSMGSFFENVATREYPISDDSLTMVLRFYPANAQTDIGYIQRAFAMLDSLSSVLEPQSYQPDMEIVMGGRLQRQMVEVNAITDEVTSSFGLGVVVILLLVTGYFFVKAYYAKAKKKNDLRTILLLITRIPVIAALIGIPLILSLLWTFGLAQIVYGSLNMMTSILGLILFGLSIDYGIHFYARYSEERAEGRSVEESVVATFQSSGQAITIAGLTTAISLFVLIFADFKGFSEFGFIACTGIIFGLISMLFVLSALLVVFERTFLLSLQPASPHKKKNGGKPFPAPVSVVVLSLVTVVAAVVLTPNITFEYDFDTLEPVFEEYENRHQVISRVYPTSNYRNPAFILIEDPEDVEPLLEQLRSRVDSDTTILSVEALQERFPTDPETQATRLARLAEIRELLDSPLFKLSDNEDLQRLREASQTTEPVQLSDVPDYLTDMFTSRDGTLGSFIMIYPEQGLSDGRNSIAFSEAIGSVELADGTVYHSTSTSLVAAEMLRLLQLESPWIISATFILVLLLMYLNFRDVQLTLLALVPLVAGMLWTFLLMEIAGVKLNFYNMIVLPVLLGIGNDAGVHIVHRYMELGRGSIRQVLGSTGKHVAMASVTTMIGFSGSLLSSHPGLRSIGHIAVLGIASTLLSALLFLPALIQLLENLNKCPSKIRQRVS